MPEWIGGLILGTQVRPAVSDLLAHSVLAATTGEPALTKGIAGQKMTMA
jgi:hypothetical protein